MSNSEHERYGHLGHLEPICAADVQQLNEKERQYGASWKSRGGVGAFMMLARKWDRLENMIRDMRTYTVDPTTKRTITAGPYDIFAHTQAQTQQGGAETLMDTIGDLRRYLLLVEAEIIRQEMDGVPLGLTQDIEGGIEVTTEHVNDIGANGITLEAPDFHYGIGGTDD